MHGSRRVRSSAPAVAPCEAERRGDGGRGRPARQLAAKPGCAGRGRRAIAADAALRTTATACFAAGDVCAAQHPSAGRPLARRALGRRARTGEGRGPPPGRRRRRDVGRRPGLLVDDRTHTLKYAAWGDGFAEDRLVDHDDGAWTVWYARADGRWSGC